MGHYWKRNMTTALFRNATLVLGLISLGYQSGVTINRREVQPLAAPPRLTPEQAEILSHLSLVYLDDGQGGTRKTIRVRGVNVQLVNGLGATNGYPTDPTTVDDTLTTTNGLGNLILGYDDLPRNPTAPLDRTGSHNLVAGFGHNYSSFGGQVVGFENTTSAAYAVVSGGGANVASGVISAVAGGINNHASGVDAAISGGFQNTASGFVATVSGGVQNEASGDFTVVSGGQGNRAIFSSAAVSGGAFNLAEGFASTVSGGSSRTVSDDFDWAAGSLFEDF